MKRRDRNTIALLTIDLTLASVIALAAVLELPGLLWQPELLVKLNSAHIIGISANLGVKVKYATGMVC